MRYFHFCLALLLLFPYSLSAQSPFAIVELSDQPRPIGGELIATLDIKPKPMKGLCPYWTILEEAERQAKELGGNCLVITEHQLPRSSKGCHRITAQVLLLEDAQPFEKEIAWHPDRRLTYGNFHASPDNRPGQASAASGFGYTLSSSPISGRHVITISSTFYPRESYFQPEDDSLFVLGHEQLHFDITELFARKFHQRILEEVNTAEDVNFQLQRIQRSLQSEWEIYQNAYDASTYEDPSRQPEWKAKVWQELEELSAFSEKTIEMD